jgi:hypothetical protein
MGEKPNLGEIEERGPGPAPDIPATNPLEALRLGSERECPAPSPPPAGCVRAGACFGRDFT